MYFMVGDRPNQHDHWILISVSTEEEAVMFAGTHSCNVFEVEIFTSDVLYVITKFTHHGGTSKVIGVSDTLVEAMGFCLKDIRESSGIGWLGWQTDGDMHIGSARNGHHYEITELSQFDQEV